MESVLATLAPWQRRQSPDCGAQELSGFANQRHFTLIECGLGGMVAKDDWAPEGLSAFPTKLRRDFPGDLDRALAVQPMSVEGSPAAKTEGAIDDKGDSITPGERIA